MFCQQNSFKFRCSAASLYNFQKLFLTRFGGKPYNYVIGT